METKFLEGYRARFPSDREAQEDRDRSLFSRGSRLLSVKHQKCQLTIRPSSPETVKIFRAQERERYRVPERPFTYSIKGLRTVVAPMKRGNPGTKPREHFLLKPQRPSFVTVLCLVRDAAARMPGGIGTRADVCELLRDSQYVVDDVSDAQINQVVSGALDRLHYEKDPCVKYDSERKIWLYLHRVRTEKDFETAAKHTGKSKILKAPKGGGRGAGYGSVSSPNDPREYGGGRGRPASEFGGEMDGGTGEKKRKRMMKPGKQEGVASAPVTQPSKKRKAVVQAPPEYVDEYEQEDADADLDSDADGDGEYGDPDGDGGLELDDQDGSDADPGNLEILSDRDSTSHSDRDTESDSR